MVSKDTIRQKLFSEKLVTKTDFFQTERENYINNLTSAHSEIYELVKDEVKQEVKTDYTNLTSQLQNDYINSDNKIIQKVNELTKEIDEIKKQLNKIIKELNKL